MHGKRLGRLPRIPAGIAALALLGAALPAPALAQQVSADSARPAPADTGTVHTVRKGDTLWDLARQYLSDPFQWPVLYRLNGDVVEDPHWIYPGERIRIVAGEPPATVAGLRVTAPEPMGDAEAEEVPAEEPEVRFGASRGGDERLLGALGERAPAAAVNQGDYVAAPYVGPVGGPGGGRLVGAAAPAAVGESAERWMQLHEDVYLELPAGGDASPGAQYLIYTLGPRLHGVGQVVQPVAVARVLDAQPGQAARARIVKQFHPVRIGQRLVPLDTITERYEQPQATSEVVHTKVLWANDDPLPTTQDFVLLESPADGALQPGDEVTLLRPSRTMNGAVVPEEPVAVARVVRVEPGAATALVTGQRHPVITVGMPARVTGRLP